MVRSLRSTQQQVKPDRRGRAAGQFACLFDSQALKPRVEFITDQALSPYTANAADLQSIDHKHKQQERVGLNLNDRKTRTHMSPHHFEVRTGWMHLVMKIMLDMYFLPQCFMACKTGRN